MYMTWAGPKTTGSDGGACVVLESSSYSEEIFGGIWAPQSISHHDHV